MIRPVPADLGYGCRKRARDAIHHGYVPGILHPRRPHDADRAELLTAVAVTGSDEGDALEIRDLRFGADHDLNSGSFEAGVQDADQSVSLFEGGEELLCAIDVPHELRLTQHARSAFEVHLRRWLLGERCVCDGERVLDQPVDDELDLFHPKKQYLACLDESEVVELL